MRLTSAIFILLFGLRSFAQSTYPDTCKLDGWRQDSTLSATTTIIPEALYDSLRELYFVPVLSPTRIVNSDSLEKAMVKKFPAVFALKDSCYTFKMVKGNTEKVCTKNGNNMKAYSMYQFMDTRCDLVRIYMEVFEGWGNYYVNPYTGVALYAGGLPNFVGCDYLYSVDNYYGEGEFSLIDLRSKKELVLRYNDWRIEESFHTTTYFLFKLMPVYCRTPKFMMVHIDD